MGRKGHTRDKVRDTQSWREMFRSQTDGSDSSLLSGYDVAQVTPIPSPSTRIHTFGWFAPEQRSTGNESCGQMTHLGSVGWLGPFQDSTVRGSGMERLEDIVYHAWFDVCRGFHARGSATREALSKHAIA